MQYTGKLFHPPGAHLYLNLSALSPIQGRLAFDVFAQLKTRISDDAFTLEIDPAPAYPRLLLGFQRFGLTAAVFSFLPAADPDCLDAALAVLPRLDRSDDFAAMASLLKDPRLSVINPDDFESAHRHAQPLAAAYFTSEPALNSPLLHGLMSLAGAALFDRLGLLT